MDSIVDGDRLTFTVSDLSTFVIVPKHVHRSSEWILDKMATCAEGGVGHFVCVICGEFIKVIELVKTEDHVFGDWEIILESTCGRKGIQVKKCTICGQETSHRVGIMPTGEHVVGDWELNADDGKEHKYCTVCGVDLDVRDPQ